MSIFWKAAQTPNPGVRWDERPAPRPPVVVKVAARRAPATFTMPKLAWEFQLPAGPKPIDFDRLRKDLESMRPHNREDVARGQGVQATCESCGWASGPVDSRESLEDLIEEKGGHTTPGGPRLQASCPHCFAGPLNEEKA